MLAFESQIVETLWPVLCHSLWSIPLIGLAIGYRLEKLTPSQGDLRMRIATIVCIVAPFLIAFGFPDFDSIRWRTRDSHFEVPAIVTTESKDSTPEMSRPSIPALETGDARDQPPKLISFGSHVRNAAMWIIPAWLAGIAVLTVRLIAGVVAFRIRTRCETADESVQSMADRLSSRLKLVHPPIIRISKSVDQPMVMGLFSPKVILPPRWSRESEIACLEAVLAHELAHVRRRDLVHLLIERVAGILWFFHPAIHRSNRNAALWREMATDRLAMEVTDDPLALARALESTARWAGVKPGMSRFESSVVTFASSSSRTCLSARIDALLRPEGVRRMRISKMRFVSCLVSSVAFAFMATKLAAIDQITQANEKKPTGETTSAEKDLSDDQAGENSVQPAPGTIWIGRLNRIRSKSMRESKVPAANPNKSFEVRLVSVSGKDLDFFLDEKFTTLRTADGHQVWIVNLEQVSNAANTIRRKLIHNAPNTTAADGELLTYTFTMPLTTVKYHPVHQGGKVRAIKPLPQTTDYDIHTRIAGKSGPGATHVEIKGLESMPKTIEKVLSPIQVERENLPPHGVMETVVTSQSEPFEATAEVPHGKSLVIKLGRTMEVMDDNLVTAAFQLANPKLWNKDVHRYMATQRYLIVTPAELP